MAYTFEQLMQEHDPNVGDSISFTYLRDLIIRGRISCIHEKGQYLHFVSDQGGWRCLECSTDPTSNYWKISIVDLTVMKNIVFDKQPSNVTTSPIESENHWCICSGNRQHVKNGIHCRG